LQYNDSSGLAKREGERASRPGLGVALLRSGELRMTKIVKDCSEPNLAEIIDSSWFEPFRVWGSTPYAEAYEDKYVKRMTFRDPHGYNGIFFARLTKDNIEEKIEESVAHFKSRKFPMKWYVGPTSEPTDLATRLEAHGFVHSVAMPGMAIELDSINQSLEWPQDLRVSRVQDDQTLRHWCEVACPAFELRDYIDSFLAMERHIGFGTDLPRRSYIGYLNERPVATSNLLLTCGVAGVFCVAAIPEVRRRGIGARMTLEALREARDMGYGVGVLHSSRIGYNTYRRIGFEEHCKIHIYKRQNEP